MKIIEKNHERLVIVDRPWLLAGAVGVMVLGIFSGITDPANGTLLRLFLAVCALGLIWLIWAKFPFQRYTFDRDKDWLRRERWHLWQHREDGMAISGIEAVRQEANWSENARLTRLTVQFDGAPAPLTESFGSTNLDQIETEIRDWLTAPGAD